MKPTEKTVIDCPDPRALAEFYCQVPGMRINDDMDGWVVIGSGPGLRQLAFQRAADWIPPRWPDPAHSAGHPFCIVFGHHSTD
jgi:catechol 2,3-dioxygenase-like lactoylglutathione lyase family enzyme